MTKLLDEGIKAVRQLPTERQDAAGELLLSIAAGEGLRYRLSPEQIKGVREAQAQVARGEFASDDEIGAVFGKRFA
jgi:hypothetical protein